MSNSESAHAGQAQPTAVFAPSPNPAPSIGSVILFLLAFVLIFGGIYLMSLAFSVTASVWVFSGGLAAVVVGLWLPFGIIPSRDR